MARDIDNWSSIITLAILIINFFLTGWIGGIALLIAFVVIIGPIGQRMSYMMFKIEHPNAKFLNY